jgi:hypothetical protein
MVHKEGKYLVNARVDVVYTEGKPKIKFGYTTNNVKKQAREQSKFSLIHILIISILIAGVMLFFEYTQIETDYPTNCSGIFYGNTSLKEVYKLNVTCDTGNYIFKYDPTKGLYGYSTYPTFKIVEKNDEVESLFNVFMVLLLPFLLSIPIHNFIIKTNWYRSWYPKFQARTRRKKYYKFKKDDVENNLVEIPYFSNVELDYKTKGDFSKYLTNIKIREHKWNPYERKRKKWIIKKLKRDDYAWYARFYFKKKPENGFLEVIYN